MLRESAKTILPAFVVQQLRKAKFSAAYRIEGAINKHRDPKAIFSEIYRKNLWGGSAEEPYSGDGSRGDAADLYVAGINAFIADHGVRSVTDIGCGDYRIGRRIVCDRYTGLDIVPDLVARHERDFGSETRRFVCFNAAGDAALPSADLYLVRQVFQHLSNRQIESILTKLRGCRFVIVTEHQPADADFRGFNADKAPGGHTRLCIGSGVYLDKPPFNARARQLFEYAGRTDADSVYARGSIRTFLLEG